MVPTVTFTVTKGALKGQEFLFRKPRSVIVGRAPECRLLLGDVLDPTVSRHHCVLEIDPPNVSVRDLGSLNGTYINDLRLGGRDRAGHLRVGVPTAMVLYHGDVVRVGETSFRVTTSQAFPQREPSSQEDRTEMLVAQGCAESTRD